MNKNRHCPKCERINKRNQPDIVPLQANVTNTTSQNDGMRVKTSYTLTNGVDNNCTKYDNSGATASLLDDGNDSIDDTNPFFTDMKVNDHGNPFTQDYHE